MELLEQQSEVLEQFAAADLHAFEALFHQFQAEVYGWIVRIVRDHSAAEDLTIETFWRLYRAHARFDPKRSLGAWARRIAVNVAIDHLKKARTEEVQLPEDPPWSAEHNARCGDPGTQRELCERTRLAFRQLPAKLQAVAALALIEECPHSEIAEALDISPSAVKSRLFRAVALLRRKLGNLGPNP